METSMYYHCLCCVLSSVKTLPSFSTGISAHDMYVRSLCYSESRSLSDSIETNSGFFSVGFWHCIHTRFVPRALAPVFKDSMRASGSRYLCDSSS